MFNYYGHLNFWELDIADSQLKRTTKQKASSPVKWFDGKPMDKHQYRSSVVQKTKTKQRAQKRE